MPALNFQERFAPLVESGEKRQTIRAYRKDKRDPKVGDTLYLYTGMRTKACRKLMESRCTDVRRFEIHVTDEGGLYWLLGEDATDDHCQVLTTDECAQIAIADGFNGHYAMTDWFDKTHGLPFEGLLIRWGKPDA